MCRMQNAVKNSAAPVLKKHNTSMTDKNNAPLQQQLHVSGK
jgi:hypothetical protein